MSPSKESVLMNAISTSDSQWQQYIQIILAEVKEINQNVQKLEDRIGDLEKHLVEFRATSTAKDEKLKDLEIWKKSIDEVASPSQLKEHVLQIDQLKTFKAKAITVFAVVQFGMAIALFVARFVK